MYERTPRELNLIGFGIGSNYPYLSTTIHTDYLAREAGRDAACVFRSLVPRSGAKSASEKAIRTMLNQCPPGYLYEACRAFNCSVEQKAWAVCWQTELAIQAIEVIDCA